ncbi:MAG: reverse transcriptase family protein [Pirellulales bacterium]
MLFANWAVRIIGLVACLLPVGLVFLLAAVSWLDWQYRVRFGRHPWHWLRAKLGWGRGIQRLARLLQVDLRELQDFRPGYRAFKLAKRRGGQRTIHAPDDRTKKLQRAVLHRLLYGLRAYPAACGFERGKSIVENAQPHAGQCVVVKMDVRDFFTSTTARRVELYFRRIGWSAAAARLLAQIVCLDGGLPQGAPTSPRLSNLVNYYLDVQLAAYARRRKGSYTRYADDMTFSFPKDYPKRIRGLVQVVRRVLKAHGYEPCHEKTRILRRHQRQMVTGLVVNQNVHLPRSARRRLRAMRHRLAQGKPTEQTPAQCRGWLALESMVESRARIH